MILCRADRGQRARQSGEHRPNALRARVAITVDLHEGDDPSDVTVAAEWLVSAGVPATFFAPSTMFQEPRYAERLRGLAGLGHEVGSHTHRHDGVEVAALIAGGRSRLGFLEESKKIFEDFYGRAPCSFRSPAWCMLGPPALDELERLGYAVDSSATPQRLSLLGPNPFRGAWTLSPRRLHYIRPGLLEVPTSTFLVPANKTTFLIFRRTLSLMFVRLLLGEAALLGERVVTLQFHPDDFNPFSKQCPPCGRLRLRDFWLRKNGGFGFKHHLKETDFGRISATTHAIVRLAAHYGCATLMEIARAVSTTSRALRREAWPYASPSTQD